MLFQAQNLECGKVLTMVQFFPLTHRDLVTIPHLEILRLLVYPVRMITGALDPDQVPPPPLARVNKHTVTMAIQNLFLDPAQLLRFRAKVPDPDWDRNTGSNYRVTMATGRLEQDPVCPLPITHRVIKEPWQPTKIAFCMATKNPDLSQLPQVLGSNV